MRNLERPNPEQDKYTSQAAEFYREKLRAAVEGRNYSAPPPGTPGRAAKPIAVQRPSSDGGWGDWGSDSQTPSPAPAPKSSTPQRFASAPAAPSRDSIRSVSSSSPSPSPSME